MKEHLGDLFVKVELQMKLIPCLICPKDLSLQMLRLWYSNTELKIRVMGSDKSQEQMPRRCSCLTFFNILWLVCVLLSHPSLHLQSSPGHPVRLYCQPHHKLFWPVVCCGGKPLDMKRPHVFLLAFLDLCSHLAKDFWWRRLLLLSSAAPAARAFHQTTVESSATLASR